MSTENEEQEGKELDPMVAAYFDGTEQTSSENQQTEVELAEQKRIDDEAAEAERLRLDQESQSQNKEAEEKAEEERLAKEKAELEQQQEKPKRWDEGLNDQGKFILDKLSKGEDKDVYMLLQGKYGFENLSDDEKMIQYLAEKNPHLDREDLLFKAAEEYGVGVTDIETDDLTTEQKNYLRKQEIDRKGLLSEADKFFKDKAVDLSIPSLPNPLDEDEGYKEYLTFKEQQVAAAEEQRIQQEQLDKEIAETAQEVINTAQQIDTLPIELKINLDQGELDLKSDFVLDEAKKKQLADYANDYFPTPGEIKQHQDQNGKLDMKGYMTMLAKRLFSDQILTAVVKQSISKDRDTFTEDVLKNSTLRNNSNQHHQEAPKADIYVDAMGK